MGASKKKQMSRLSPTWAHDMWEGTSAINKGKGAAWQGPLAAIAVTGARPAALEKGIEFSVAVDEKGEYYIQALIPGVKLGDKRGQPWYSLAWKLNEIKAAGENFPRLKELQFIYRTLMNLPGKKRLVFRYDAEAISTRLREVSKSLWPQRKYHVTAYCYREEFAKNAKAAGVDSAELAMAMGHQSSESQGKYAGYRKRHGAVAPHSRPFTIVKAPEPVRVNRSPMARFKAASAKKNAAKMRL